MSCPRAKDAQSRLVQVAREVNEAKPTWVVDHVAAAIGENKGRLVACMGLAAKPGTDLFDFSPALDIARAISQRFPGRVVCTDPFQDMLAGDLGLPLADTDSAFKDASVIVFLVAHDQYRKFRPDTEKLFIDLCGATGSTGYMIASASKPPSF